MPLESRPADCDQWPFGTDVGSGDMLFRPARRTSDRAASEGIPSGDGPRPLATDCVSAPDADIEYFDRSGWHLARRVSGAPLSAADVVQAAPESYRSDCAAATLRFVARDSALEVVIVGEFGVGHYSATSVGPDLVRFWSPGLAPGVLIRFEREAGIVERVVVSTPRTRATVFQRVR